MSSSPRRLERAIEAGLARWIGWVALRRGRVLAIVLALAGLALLLSTTRLGIESDKEALFAEDLPFRKLDVRFVEQFPTLYENVVLVLDGPTSAATREAAHRLEARLRADPTHFVSVDRPRGEFFEIHGLLYLEPEELDDLGDRLARVQPMLSALASDPTLRGLARQTRRGLAARRTGEAEALDLAPVLSRMERVVRADLEGRVQQLDWSEIVRWGDATLDRRREVIYVQPRLDYGSLAAGARPIEAIETLRHELGLVEAAGFRLRATGDMVLNHEEMQLVRSQVSWAGLGSLIVVTILLFAALRSARLVLATVLSLLAGLVLTAGFATLAIGHLNMISVAFAVLFIGLGVDFGIHLCMRFQELRDVGRSTETALGETARSVGASLILCATTTAVGFFAFVPTDFRGVAELGVIAGVGMFVSVASSFTVIPALLAGPAAPPRRGARPRILRLPAWPARHPRTVSIAALACFVVAGWLAFDLRFDENPLGVRDPAAESVIVYEELLEGSRDAPWTLSHLAHDEAEALRIASRLSALPEVESARTLGDFVPRDQVEKLELIADMALFFEGRTALSDARAVPEEQTRSAIEALLRELAMAIDAQAGSVAPPSRELEVAAMGLRDALETWLAEVRSLAPAARRERFDALETRLLSTFGDLLARLEAALAVGPVAASDLPEGLRARMVSASGVHRVEILPAEDLLREGALERFVGAVQAVSPEAVGPALAIQASAETVVAALRQAFTAAALVIVVMLLLLWRRPHDMALVMVPLVWAGVMTGGAMVLLGIDFNFADVIVLPLLLGIGVDSGIHMVHRHRLAAAESILETSTARALVFSAATTIASFGTLALLPHRGMASLGRLLVVGVALTVVSNLVLLPALIALGDRVERRSGR